MGHKLPELPAEQKARTVSALTKGLREHEGTKFQIRQFSATLTMHGHHSFEVLYSASCGVRMQQRERSRRPDDMVRADKKDSGENIEINSYKVLA